MQCVGTLSWNQVAPAVRQPFGRGFSRGKAPAVRQPFGKGVSNAVGRVLGRKGKENSPKGPREFSAVAMAPETRRVRVEVRGLEQDWSQIVRRCIDGDSGAWAEMVRTHQKRVYGLCYRFTGNAADAEDLTQDVFLKIYANLGSFDAARGSLPVWIATMTRNLLVDNFRRTRNQRATSSLDEGWDQTEEFKPADRLMASGPSPHETAARKELAHMVQGALAKVSVELREAVILRDLQDLDSKEIAQVLAIPEGTVKSRISRGRAELARLLERNQREVM
jgi:RNA polymerase sigma-70 factor, ECF subfamily